MNTQSYQANLKSSADECTEIGDYIFNAERTYIYVVLPNKNGKFAVDSTGRAALDPIRIIRHASEGGLNGHRCWVWDGSESAPTLSPSIHWPGHWHGHLKSGRFVSC